MNEVGEYIHDKFEGVCKQTVKEADRLILEYMQKKGLTIDDLQGKVVIQREETLDFTTKTTYWYKGELMIVVTNKLMIDRTRPYEARAEMVIEKGDW